MNDRKKIALAVLCRSFLHINGFLSEFENTKVHNRIKQWQDNNQVQITEVQLDSADFVYNDNLKINETER